MTEIPVDPLQGSESIIPSEMMTRVALRLRSLSFPNYDPDVQQLHFWYPAARAAIKEMRKPTAGMVKYVEKHPGLMGYGDDSFDWIWSTMIDAALKPV